MQPFDRRVEDGTVTAKVLMPAPQVWEALKLTFEARRVPLSIADRPAGRMGDTAFVIVRRWNDKPGSYYFNCGQNVTGQRADNDRIKTVILAQLSRLTADSIGIAIHMSGFSTSPSGSGAAQCASSGRGETDFLDEVMRRLGGRG